MHYYITYFNTSSYACIYNYVFIDIGINIYNCVSKYGSNSVSIYLYKGFYNVSVHIYICKIYISYISEYILHMCDYT